MNIVFGDGRLSVTVKCERVEQNNMPRCHSHDSYELYYLSRGERYLFAAGSFYSVRAGDIFLIPPGVEHRTLDSGGGAYTKLTCMLPPELLPRAELPEEGVLIVRPVGEARERAAREASLAEVGTALERYSAALRLLSECLTLPPCMERVSSPTLGRMSEILGYIETHYAERITLTSLSERFFISEYYLCRLFKEYTGSTIMSYVTRLRLARARRLLERGGRVAEVARECGFGSVSAFGAAFRSAVGCSPRDYAAGRDVDRRVGL